MSIRHTRNATTKVTKRNRTSGGNELIAVDPIVVEFVNNTNIAGADVTAGNPITYRGSDHIPVGTDQYDLNA